MAYLPQCPSYEKSTCTGDAKPGAKGSPGYLAVVLSRAIVSKTCKVLIMSASHNDRVLCSKVDCVNN